MLEGTTTRDFYGRPVDKLFASTAAGALVNGFSIDDVDKLGMTKDPLRPESLQKHEPKSFEITVNGHQFTGTYESGICIEGQQRRDGGEVRMRTLRLSPARWTRSTSPSEPRGHRAAEKS